MAAVGEHRQAARARGGRSRTAPRSRRARCAPCRARRRRSRSCAGRDRSRCAKRGRRAPADARRRRRGKSRCPGPRAGRRPCKSSANSSCRRWARIAPRRWIPMRATAEGVGLRSAISCAMRTSARATSSSPRTIFPSCISIPSWPHRTGLKEHKATVSRCGDGLRRCLVLLQSSPARLLACVLCARARADPTSGSARAAPSRERERRSCRSRVAPPSRRTPRGPPRAGPHPGSASRCASVRAAAPARRARLARPVLRVECPVWRARSQLLLGERRLVHEQVRFVGGQRQHLARRGVPRDHDLAALTRGPHHLLGAHPSDRLPAREPAEVRPRRDAELSRRAQGRDGRGGSPRRSRSRKRCWRRWLTLIGATA